MIYHASFNIHHIILTPLHSIMFSPFRILPLLIVNLLPVHLADAKIRVGLLPAHEKLGDLENLDLQNRLTDKVSIDIAGNEFESVQILVDWRDTDSQDQDNFCINEWDIQTAEDLQPDETLAVQVYAAGQNLQSSR